MLEYTISDVKEELSGANKASRAEEMVRREERSQGLARRKAMEGGETSYKLAKATENNLEKKKHLDNAIALDNQTVYRATRAELKYLMTDYMGAQTDAKIWVQMMNREKKEKIKNHHIQSLLFNTYMMTNNLAAASVALTKHFDVDTPAYYQHKEELEAAYNNKKK